MPRRRRTLSDEDKRLWDEVARRITPLEKRPSSKAELASGTSVPDPAAAPPSPVSPRRFRVGQSVQTSTPPHDLAPSLGDRLSDLGQRPDRRAALQQRRGKLKPEARIDLHGMTQAQAHPRLTRFLLGAHADGLRLVLVITGKGKDRDEGGPLPVPVGVLRHQVPHWLSLPPLRSIVLRAAPAHIRHGGDGAIYVFLRRGR